MQNVSTAYKYKESDAKLISRFLSIDLNHQMEYFLSVKNQLTDYSYWFLLSTMWVNDSSTALISTWKELFAAKRTNRKISIMKPDELAVFSQLPNKLKVYRAHSEKETDWLSYTLDLKTAVDFAKRKNTSEIVEYKVKKHDCLALFLKRKEAEILCMNKDLARKIRVIIIGDEVEKLR